MSGQVILETVSDKEAGVRLDKWVKRRLQVTQGQIEKLLRTGQIRVDGARAKSNTRLEVGQEVRLPPVKQQEKRERRDTSTSEADRQFMQELVLYEDDDMIALNKPAGIAVQGGTKMKRHIDGMLGALGTGGVKPKLVHRLDKDTSGVLLVGKTPTATARLGELFRGREMQKVYWAVTVRVPNPPAGQIRSWMRKGTGGALGGDRETMIPAHQGEDGARHAVTDYAVVSTAARRAAWVALRPLTGRTHQLRFHMLEIETSILGDHKYATAREVPTGVGSGLHLHARALIIPRTRGKSLTITAPLPAHMKETFSALGFDEREAGDDPLAVF